jgi:hypothetical protein
MEKTAARRDCTKLIRFSRTELEVVSDRARACGRPVACYIRDVATGGKPRASSGTQNAAVIRELARVAMQLKALAAVATENTLPGAAEFAGTVDSVLDLVRQID